MLREEGFQAAYWDSSWVAEYFKFLSSSPYQMPNVIIWPGKTVTVDIKLKNK